MLLIREREKKLVTKTRTGTPLPRKIGELMPAENLPTTTFKDYSDFKALFDGIPPGQALEVSGNDNSISSVVHRMERGGIIRKGEFQVTVRTILGEKHVFIVHEKQPRESRGK